MILMSANTTSPANAHRSLPIAACGGLFSALAVLILYWPARNNGFVFDDLAFLVNVPVYLDPAQWKDALLYPPFSGADTRVFFRPLAMLSFVLPMWAGHTTPYIHHVVNLAFHAANVFLVSLLAWRIFAADFPNARAAVAASTLCGLVYGVYTGLTEPVLWISCRYDLMMAFFLFAALLLDRSRKNVDWRLSGGIAGLFLAALLCKETGVGFLAALPLAHLALDRTQPGAFRLRAIVKTVWLTHWRVYVGLLIALAAYFLLRLAVIGKSLGLQQHASNFSDIGSAGNHILVVVASYVRYISYALWPFSDLAPLASLPLRIDGLELLPPAAFAALFVTVALIAALRATAWRAPGFLFLAFLAALLPVSNIVPVAPLWSGVSVATRYLAFPLVFVCLAVCGLLPRLTSSASARNPRLPWIILAGWIVASAAVVRETIPLWKDNGVFLPWAIANAPPDAKRHLLLSLGGHYFKAGALLDAREAFAMATEQSVPALLAGLSWYELGNVDLVLGNYDQAIMDFQNALALDSDVLMARIGMGIVERRRGHPERAAAVLEEGLRLAAASALRHPYEDAARLQLGLAYAKLGRFDEAAAQLHSARDGTPRAAIRAAAEKALETLRSAPK